MPKSFTPEQIEGVISKLSNLDRDLLTGKCNAWGSWMWDSGSYMVSLGLGTKSQGNIQFDTPLAAAVIASLATTPTDAPKEQEK